MARVTWMAMHHRVYQNQTTASLSAPTAADSYGFAAYNANELLLLQDSDCGTVY